VVKELTRQDGARFVRSVSATTRPARVGEIEGEDYFFVSVDEFERMRKKNELIEWAEVHDNYYGTPLKNISRAQREHKVLLLDIDIQGARAIRKKYADNSLLIFLVPPSLRVLKKRLKKRRTESRRERKRRLERIKEEMNAASQFDFRVVNRTLADTVQQVREIINKQDI
jgi:guanylate kinase